MRMDSASLSVISPRATARSSVAAFTLSAIAPNCSSIARVLSAMSLKESASSLFFSLAFSDASATLATASACLLWLSIALSTAKVKATVAAVRAPVTGPPFIACSAAVANPSASSRVFFAPSSNPGMSLSTARDAAPKAVPSVSAPSSSTLVSSAAPSKDTFISSAASVAALLASLKLAFISCPAAL